MKKVLLLGLLSATVPWGECSAVDVAESEIARSSCAINEPAKAIEGFYVGLGIAFLASKNKVDCGELWQFADPGEMHKDIAAMKLDDKQMRELYAKFNLAPAVRYNGTLDNITHLHAVGFNSVANTQHRNIAGSLAVGYGCLTCADFYIGVELMADLGGRSTKSKHDICKVDVKKGAFSPALVARLGYYISAVDCLLYTRVGYAFSQSEVGNNDKKVKISSVTPVLGLGVEKVLTDKFSVRLEGDYYVGRYKKGTAQVELMYEQLSLADYNVDTQLKNHGYALRAMVCCHF